MILFYCMMLVFRPQLGHLDFPDMRRMTMADLPGLIEGSHMNLGMGHKFLKHVERTKLLLFVIDINGFQLSSSYPFRNAFETLVLLNRELELYNPDLLKKPCVLAVNKSDTENFKEKMDNFEELLDKKYEEGVLELPEEMIPEQKLDFKDIVVMSAKNDPKSVDNLKSKLRTQLDEAVDESEEKIKALSLELDTHLNAVDKSQSLL